MNERQRICCSYTRIRARAKLAPARRLLHQLARTEDELVNVILNVNCLNATIIHFLGPNCRKSYLKTMQELTISAVHL